MKINEALNYQRNNGNREQTTGYRTADNFSKRVGEPVCAALLMVCITPIVTRGIRALIGAVTGKQFNDDNNTNRVDNRNNNRF